MTRSIQSLYDYAHRLLDELRVDLLQYGIEIDEKLELRHGSSVWVYYDLTDGHIYFSLPDPDDLIGRFQLALFRPMMACETAEELNEFIGLLLPRLIAHEIGHHLRHRYKKFGDDPWLEEQVANIFASAVTRVTYSPEQRSRLIFMLERALATLKTNVDCPSLATDTYHAPLHALVAGGELSNNTVQTLELMASLFAMSPEQMFVNANRASLDLVDRITYRPEAIQKFNEDYTTEMLRYTYFQLGWSLIDIESTHHHYIGEFAHDYLGISLTSLPKLDDETKPTQSHIVRCYQAYKTLADLSPVASRYFFKRYQSALLKYVTGDEFNVDDEHAFSDQAYRLFEVQDEETDGSLKYAALFAHPGVRWLFPPTIQSKAFGIEAEFLYPIDQRIWRLVSENTTDEGASALLERLTWLEMCPLFRSLPADLLVEIARQLSHVKVSQGTLLIQQGIKNSDLFLLVSGRLGFYTGQPSASRVAVEIVPGEIIGDMAFLSGEARSTDIFAIEASDCLLIRSTLLHRLTFTHPIILMQLARILARRLNLATFG